MGKLTSTIGIPIKLLNEAQVSLGRLLPFFSCLILASTRTHGKDKKLILNQGHVVTLEITSGVVYRGKLLEGMLSLPSVPILNPIDPSINQPDLH